MSTSPTISVLSVGRLSTLFQTSPTSIEKAAMRAGVRPAMKLNGVVHFSEDDIPAIRRELKRRPFR